MTSPLSALMTWLEHRYDPFDPDRPIKPPQALLAYLRWAYQDLGPILWLMIVFAFAVGFVEVAIMDGVGTLVDRATASDPDRFFSENAWFLGGLALLILVLRPLVLTGQSMLGSIVVIPGLMSSTVWRLHRHLLGQSLRVFEDDFAGRLAQKEIQAGAATDTVTVDVVNALGLLLSFLIGMTIALGATDWRLGLATALWAAAYIGVLYVMLPKIRAAARERAERRAGVTGQLVDSISNIKTVKLYAPPGQEEEASRASIARYRRAAINFGRRVSVFRIALNVLNAAALAGMVALSLALWSGGAVTVGDATATAMLTLRLTAMSGWIAFTMLGVFREIGTLEDALGELARPHELVDPTEPTPLSSGAAANRVVFDAVSFRYARASEPEGLARFAALEEVSLAFEPGEKVGLVGPSGAGKTTLAALLLRLYDIGAGRITLGGVDIRALAQADLRARIAVVTQEAALFNRSALDNIRYGRPDASEAAARAAAERAKADAFIRDLRDIKGRSGYVAHLGERGVKLSGGQRQRIALARAFLKDAPILVLDEATSALDSEVEAAILDALSDLMAGKTVIAIAHRLSTIAQMDRIVVLDAGRVIEQGPHEALIQQGGVYARLWARQSGGFLGVAAE